MTVSAFSPDPLLKSVSRSLYTSLRILPSDLRPTMGLGYLFCRAADTLADTEIIPNENRLEILNLFTQVFEPFPLQKARMESFFEHLQEIATLPNSSEGKLLKLLPKLWSQLETLPRTDQALIQQVVLGVLRGMQIDLTIFASTEETTTCLPDKQSLEAYLLSIGGEPGKFWSQLCLAHSPKLKIKNRQRWIEDGITLGTGLQMINILRDLGEDLARGRCYLPEEFLLKHGLSVEDLVGKEKKELFFTFYHEQIDATLKRLEHGVEYIFQIPKSYFRYRLACWWPLGLGLKTLAALRNSSKVLEPKDKVKIKKSAVYKTMLESLWLLWSNRGIRWRYEKLRNVACSKTIFKRG